MKFKINTVLCSMLIVLSMGCSKEKVSTITSPAPVYPDPIIGDFHFDDDIVGSWILDSSMVRYTNKEKGITQYAIYYNTNSTNVSSLVCNDDSYQWLIRGKTETGTYEYTHEAIAFEQLYNNLFGVLLNVDQDNFSCCFNISQFTTDPNSREMYFFSRKK